MKPTHHQTHSNLSVVRRMTLRPMQNSCMSAAIWSMLMHMELPAPSCSHLAAEGPGCRDKHLTKQGPDEGALLQNAGPEAAMEWVLSHMEDPDFNEPLPAPISAPAAALQQRGQAADPEQVAMLGAMGFTTEQVLPILQECAISHLHSVSH